MVTPSVILGGWLTVVGRAAAAVPMALVSNFGSNCSSPPFKRGQHLDSGVMYGWLGGWNPTPYGQPILFPHDGC